MPKVALTAAQRRAHKDKDTVERATRLIKMGMAKRGLNQRDLARRIGVDPSTLGRRMRGESEFRVSELRTIADALNLDAETRAALMGGEKCKWET